MRETKKSGTMKLPRSEHFYMRPKSEFQINLTV